MTTIAVDALGGDHAPAVPVEGALLAAREYGLSLLLIGPPKQIEAELEKHDASGLKIELVPAGDVIGMDESPVKALRRKPEATVRVAAHLVREGRAQGFVSAGNTGAAMAAAKMEWGAIPGVDRPALATIFPTQRGIPSVLLDVGANIGCKPQHLVQFAVMGEVYYRVMFGVQRPRVGLLSIGEEATKGNEVIREAHRRLRESPLSFEFVGNVEGHDVFSGDVHVAVCDGLVGNVALKISEGVAEAIVSMLKEALSSTITAKVGAVLSRQAFEEFRRRVDWSEYGGAPLLGVKGVAIVCHGRSPVNAIKNALGVAHSFAEKRVNEKIERELTLVSGR
ncbi:MAG TPA: phosphate acyltransferase PlsX [Candidatus Xenobia bacterium]|nr:phosphate acyltransferase PlsX [Candidatus Xenobia bacterium]